MQNKALIDRFLRYVRIDTQSAEDAGRSPSTAKQFDLADLLAEELTALGAEVDYDREFGYVYAKIPGEEPALGFLSHMDTSPEASGAGVQPRIFTYDGHDALLDMETFPELKNHIGEELIATDGTTLLGADDKAGVAEIMNLAAYYHDHPEERHRTIAICFTPDEEIGEGTAHFDPARFAAKEAYTVDGGKFGILEYECFNAAGAKLDFYGKNVHTGSAKNSMVNAILLAMEFQSLLPPAEAPEYTEGYEGFYHPYTMEGDVEHAQIKYLIRDFDKEKFAARKQYLQNAADYMKRKYGAERVSISIADQYYNMREPMKDHMDLIDNAAAILRELGTEPLTEPIRGGTDGANLSFRGIPCPNLSTGGYNFHGRYEYASIPEMEKSAEVLIRLVRIA